MLKELKVTMSDKNIFFLFTDIQGSTQLWEKFQEKMGKAVALHDSIMKTSIQKHNGKVFKTMGDAFFAVFEDSSKALLSAVEIQRKLSASDFGEIGRIKVRMALHSGPAEERDNDYFGPTLNRVARLLSAGHGGQILLSQAFYEVSGNQSVKDLGERRLKDLIKPEHVYQVLIEGLEADFPPLKTIDSRPNNLPEFPTTLIGREKELKEIKELVRREDTGLVTLTGVGGTGKTRLAIQAGADMIDEFEDGVFFIDLSPIKDDSLFLVSLADFFGLKGSKEQKLLDILTVFLKEKHLLLILDNFEQIVEAAEVVGTLLKSCPKLELLVTSRIPLHISAEHEYVVSPLELPSARDGLSLEDVEKYSALQLFVKRASLANHGFIASNENICDIAEICIKLDGLPLAIELAAARVKFFSPRELLVKFSVILAMTGNRDLPKRQQTIKSMIAWSYDILSENEKKILRVLSLFEGKIFIEASLSIVGEEALEIMLSLLDKNLLRKEESASGMLLFSMLETIKDFGHEKLAENKEREDVSRKFVNYYVGFSGGKGAKVWEHDSKYWVEKFAAEMDNIKAAIALAVNTETAEQAISLAIELIQILSLSSNHLQINYWCDSVINMRSFKPMRTVRKADLLLMLARINAMTEKGIRLLNEACEIFRELGDDSGLGRCSFFKAQNYSMAGKYEESLREAEKGVNFSLNSGDKKTEGLFYRHLGQVYYWQGKYEQSIVEHKKSVEIMEGLDLPVEIGNSLEDLSYPLLSLDRKVEFEAVKNRMLLLEDNVLYSPNTIKIGRVRKFINELTVEDLKPAHESVLAEFLMFKNGGNILIATGVEGKLGFICTLLGQYEEAERYLLETLDLSRQMDNRRSIVDVLVLLAFLRASQGRNKTAALLFGVAIAECARLKITLPVFYYKKNYELLREKYDEKTLQGIFKEAELLTPDEYFALAQDKEKPE